MTGELNRKSAAFVRFETFMKNVKNTDIIALQHDTDDDGLSAGTITAHAIFALIGKFPEVVFYQGREEPPLGQKRVDWLREQKVTKLISVDISLDQDSRKEYLEQIAEFADCLNIDHHKLYNPLFDHENAHVIKPQQVCSIDPSKYACGKFCYDLFTAIGVDLKVYAWKSCIGILGDVGYDQWKKFTDDSLRQVGLTTNGSWYEELTFGKVLQVISSVGSLEIERLGEVYEDLLAAQHPRDLLTSRWLSYIQRFEDEIKATTKEFLTHKEEYPEKELVLYRFSRPTIGTGVVINQVSFQPEFRNKTIIMVKDASPEKITFSCRRQDGQLKCNELLEQAVKGLPEASAGGHNPAAGGVIRKQDWDQFKTNLLVESEKVVKQRHQGSE